MNKNIYIYLRFQTYMKTVMVNDSTYISKTDNYISPQINKHKQDHNIWHLFGLVRIMVFKATFNNISDI